MKGMTTRVSRDDAFMIEAMGLSLRSTCIRRHVGCVLVNSRGHIIGSGYNGTAAGDMHCITELCPGAYYPSGEGLDKCEAIHAEQNALAQCRTVWDIQTVYTTTSPCKHCLKMLKNTSASRIVYYEGYSEVNELQKYWMRENPERIAKGLSPRTMELYQGKIKISLETALGQWKIP